CIASIECTHDGTALLVSGSTYSTGAFQAIRTVSTIGLDDILGALCFSSAAHFLRITGSVAYSADFALLLELTARATVVVRIIAYRSCSPFAGLRIAARVVFTSLLTATITFFAV